MITIYGAGDDSVEWRFQHGVGPEPHPQATACELPRYHPPALPGTVPAGDNPVIARTYQGETDD
jgi:hypothetical protein